MAWDSSRMEMSSMFPLRAAWCSGENLFNTHTSTRVSRGMVRDPQTPTHTHTHTHTHTKTPPYTHEHTDKKHKLFCLEYPPIYTHSYVHTPHVHTVIQTHTQPHTHTHTHRHTHTHT